MGALVVAEALTDPNALRLPPHLTSGGARMRMMAHSQSAAPEDDGLSADVETSTRLTVEAKVTLKRPSVRPPETGFFWPAPGGPRPGNA